MKSYHWMFLSLVVGGLAGWCANLLSVDTQSAETLNFVVTQFLTPIGQLFLRLMFMVVVPMVLSALILGVYELSATEGVKKILGRTVGWTIVLSSISVLIGIGLINWIEPGKGFDFSGALAGSDFSKIKEIHSNASQAKPIAQVVVELIPKNPLEAAVRAMEGEMLSLMIFSVIFGLALGAVTKTRGNLEPVMVPFLRDMFDVSIRIVQSVMKMAPLAVFVLVFSSAAKMGPDIFKALFSYVAVVLLGLVFHMVVVYGLALKLFAGRSPTKFFRNISEVLLTSFSTASSNATLPYSLDTAEFKLGLPPRISRFVLTVGATANQNGTALFEGVTVLFLAQVYGVDLTGMQQLQVVLMSILAGIGTAGVPGGSLPLIVILLQTVGIPAEGIGIILGIDRVLDMCRTAVNVSGDLVIATLVSKE